MNRLLLVLIAAGLAASATVQGQSQDAAADQLPPVQAPPAMEELGTPSAQTTTVDPNVKTIPLANSDEVARAAAADAKKAAAEAKIGLPATAPTPPTKPLESPGLPPEVQKAAEATELPVITVRQNGNETVEEYRKRGKLYFVRVQPTEGPTRFYVDNRSDIPPNLQQLSAPSGVVQPVYFKLLDWK